MSELTERVRRMLSQAQVFARDTPFEAVTRARQTLQVIDEALAGAAGEERTALKGLRKIAASRLAKYEDVLAKWLAEAESRNEAYVQRERHHIVQPLRARGD